MSAEDLGVPAENYIREHGRVSWEVNALSPATVNRLFEAKLKALIDLPKMNAVIAKEKKGTAALRRATRQIVADERRGGRGGDEEEDGE